MDAGGTTVGQPRRWGQLKRLGTLGRRFAVDTAYRTHVLDVIQRMTQLNTTDIGAIDEERDLGWIEGARVFFIGGCELTYIKEAFDALGATTYHTFDHGRSSDPLGEVLDDTSPLWSWTPDHVVLSQVQVASGLFHKTQWSGAAYEIDQQEADLGSVAANYGQAVDRIIERLGTSTFLLTHPLVYRPALGCLEYRSLSANLSLAEMIRRYELAIYRVAKERERTYVVDVASAFELDGKRDALQADSELLGEHFTRAGATSVFDQLVTSMTAITSGTRKIKCAVFDLDDTLWSGVLREIGEGGVVVRHAYLRAIRYLASRGILIALCSKNDPVEAQYLEPLLGAGFCSHVVATKLSWDLKSTSIRELSEELGLGLDSFAFFDDNERERAEVRQNLPEVLVLSDSDILRSLALPEFQPAGVVTTEAKARARSYQAEADRTAAQAASPQTQEEFLASLELRLTTRRPLKGELDRVYELLARTNQLNATVNRTSMRELQARFADTTNHDIRVALLEDRFGEYGLVGAVLATKIGDTWSLHELAFSCRAMGRGVEQACLVELAARARAAGAESLSVDFIPSDRNSQMRIALDEAGFRATGPFTDGTVTLELDLTDDPAVPPAWFAEVVAR